MATLENENMRKILGVLNEQIKNGDISNLDGDSNKRLLKSLVRYYNCVNDEAIKADIEETLKKLRKKSESAYVYAMGMLAQAKIEKANHQNGVCG